MKKLMALCLSLLMVLSMCSFTVMAEDEVDFSAIANGQPQDFVVSNLDTTTYSITSSSNTAVIALDGTVKRPLFEDAKVTIAVGASTYDVTVKAQSCNAIAYMDFSDASKTTLVDYGWDIAAAKYTDEHPLYTISNDKVSFAFDSDTTTYGRPEAKYYTDADGSRATGASINVSNIAATLAGADLRIGYTQYFTDGTSYVNTGAMVYRMNNTSSGNCVQANGLTSGMGTFFTDADNSAGKSFKMQLKLYPNGEFYVGDKNGNLVEATSDLTEDAQVYTSGDNKGELVYEGRVVDYVKLDYVVLCNAGGSTGATFDADDLVIYEDVPSAEIIANATPAEKASYYSKFLAESYITNGSLSGVTEDLTLTPDEELVDGVSISWESNNEAVLANDGTVNRPALKAETATLTGTLSVEGAADVVKTYTVTVLPCTISGMSEIIDFDSYGLADGAAIAETGWTVNSNVTAKNVIADGNSYADFSYSTGSRLDDGVNYTFSNAPETTERYYIMSFKYKCVVLPNEAINVGIKLNETKIGEFVQRSTYLHAQNWGNGGGLYGDAPTTSGTAGGYYVTTPTDFVELKFVVDTQESMVHCYAGDKLLLSTGTKAATIDLSTISKAEIYIDWGKLTSGSAHEICLDDIKVYTEQSLDSVLADATDAEKVNIYKQLIEDTALDAVTVAGTVADLDKGYADYAPANYGVNISWSSGNSAYIDGNGMVAKLAPVGETATVNMTATITAGSETATAVAPITIGDGLTLVKSDDFTDTTLVRTGDATNAELFTQTEFVTDEDTNSTALKLVNDTAGVHKRSGNMIVVVGGDYTDRTLFEADVKYTHGDGDSRGGICVWGIGGSNAMTIYLDYKNEKIRLSTTLPKMAENTVMSTAVNTTLDYPMPASVVEKGEGEWVHLAVDHNALSQTYQLYVDGTLVNEVPILIANMVIKSNGGTSIRGFSIELSGVGTALVDNASLKKYDSDAAEVNAALNAALILYGQEAIEPVLTNRSLAPMTIGKSWAIKNDYGNYIDYNRDIVVDGDTRTIKIDNPGTYTFVTDGPAVTYEINGVAATEINVTAPGEITFTVTATANGITESKTVTRKVAPLGIRAVALSDSALNGVWMNGTPEGDEKLIVAQYSGNKLVDVEIMTFKTDDIIYKEDSTDVKTGYVEDLNIMYLSGINNPKNTAEVSAIKIMVVDGNGITPVTFANDDVEG